MYKSFVLFLVCLACFVSCNNNTSDNTSKETAKSIPVPAKSNLNDTGTAILMNVVNKYYDLKNALVKTNPTKADSAANMLATSTDSLKIFLSNNNNGKDTVTPYAKLAVYIDTVITQSKIAEAIDDKTCEKQRLVFSTISSAIYGLVKAAGLKNVAIYQEHCPMAFNEKGANWLSDDIDIKNPYFGKKMLECGEVIDSIK